MACCSKTLTVGEVLHLLDRDEDEFEDDVYAPGSDDELGFEDDEHR